MQDKLRPLKIQELMIGCRKNQILKKNIPRTSPTTVITSAAIVSNTYFMGVV
ncbi:hypothetical protein PULV_a2558 [Pseudoalteromonas ulvae UL12]|nr:hypothetical protein [Pseudoalteromonas ulvae UL12]